MLTEETEEKKNRHANGFEYGFVLFGNFVAAANVFFVYISFNAEQSGSYECE